MLEVNNVDILVSTRFLVKSLSFSLNRGDKLAIIGEEGNGKSTLLKSLLGICEYAEVTGTIQFKNNKVGYLEQTMNPEYEKKKVYDFLFSDDSEYYERINNFYKYLEFLHLEDTLLEQVISTLSGEAKATRTLKELNRQEVVQEQSVF